MKASRYNEGKPKLSYFVRSFRWMLEAVARIKEFGANKYEDDNWRLGNKSDVEYLDSAQRHLDSFLGGEFYDPDSGCAHLGQVVWNFCALAELNYPHMPVIDKELFAERMAYWAEEKRKKEKERGVDDLPKFVPKTWEWETWPVTPWKFDPEYVVDVTGDYLRAINSPMRAPVFLDAPPDFVFEVSRDVEFDTMQFRQDIREALKEIDKQEGEDE